MITKENFIKRMELIQNFHSEQDTMQVLINKITDGYSIVTVGDYIINEMIKMIAESFDSNDSILIDDYLGWWLYEDVDKVIYESDGSKEYSVRTLDELYNYLANNKC